MIEIGFVIQTLMKMDDNLGSSRSSKEYGNKLENFSNALQVWTSGSAPKPIIDMTEGKRMDRNRRKS